MKKILIIEDDLRIATALQIRFKANGYQAVTAPDAIAARTLALQLKPDLICLDISLPGGDGLRLAEELRQRPGSRGTPMIFVTASKDPDLRRRTMELGAAGLFDKPYDAEELLQVVRHALGETTMTRKAPQYELGPPGPSPAPSPVKKILIIEDDRKIAMALTIRLKSAGYGTTMAFDALTVITAAVKLKPDLLLLDVSMPAGNGFTVAERVQTLFPAAVPIIFITASKQPAFRKRADELGAAGFFEKPYDPDKLMAAISRILSAPGLTSDPTDPSLTSEKASALQLAMLLTASPSSGQRPPVPQVQ